MAISPKQAQKLTPAQLNVVEKLESIVDGRLLQNYTGQGAVKQLISYSEFAPIPLQETALALLSLKVRQEFSERYAGTGWKNPRYFINQEGLFVEVLMNR
ncbi:MAG: hypothetical protein AABX11_00730 [Nanoarchaeota archaeon]